MKPNGHPDHYATGGSGSKFDPQAGKYEIAKTEYAVRNMKNKDGSPVLRDGKPIEPDLVFRFVAHTLDASWNRVADEEPDDMPIFTLGFGKTALNGMRPGMAKGPEDDDPKDLGRNEASGPTLYCEPGAEINQSSGYGLFTRTLAIAGYPKERLARLWAPDFEGLKFEFKSLPGAEANKLFGWKGKDAVNEKPVDGKTLSVKVVTAVRMDAAAKTNGAAKPLTVDEMASNLIAAVAKEHAGKLLKHKSYGAWLKNQYSQALHYPDSQQAEVLKKAADRQFLDDYAAMRDMAIIVTDEGVSFPALA